MAKPISDVTATATTAAAILAQGTATASCGGGASAAKKGKKLKPRLVSGGFSSNVGGVPSAIALPHLSQKSGESWTYSALNNISAAQVLTSHAYCAKGVKAPKVVSATNTQSIGPGTSISAATSPNCPKGKTLSAGGFASTIPIPTLVPVVTESRALEPSWLANSYKIAGTGPVSITAQGICL